MLIANMVLMSKYLPKKLLSIGENAFQLNFQFQPMIIDENLFPHLPLPQIAGAPGQAFKMTKFRVALHRNQHHD